MTHYFIIINFLFVTASSKCDTVTRDNLTLGGLAVLIAILLLLLMLALGTMTVAVVVLRKRIRQYKGQCDESSQQHNNFISNNYSTFCVLPGHDLYVKMYDMWLPLSSHSISI